MIGIPLRGGLRLVGCCSDWLFHNDFWPLEDVSSPLVLEWVLLGFDGPKPVDGRSLADRKPLKRWGAVGDDASRFSSSDDVLRPLKSPLGRLEIQWEHVSISCFDSHVSLTFHWMIDPNYLSDWNFHLFVTKASKHCRVVTSRTCRTELTNDWLTRRLKPSMAKLFINSTAWLQLSASAKLTNLAKFTRSNLLSNAGR